MAVNFFIKFRDQEQFWNLLVMRKSKLSLIFRIDEELTEVFKVKDLVEFLYCPFLYHVNCMQLFVLNLSE